MSHWIRSILAVAAALAAAVALPAHAQLVGGRRMPAPANPTERQEAQPAQPGADANQRLQQVSDTANNVVSVAKIAQKKAQSAQAKDLANKVVSEWQPVVNQVNALAKERGMKVAGASAQAKADLKGTSDQLNRLSGGSFDQAFVQAEVRGFETVEQQLKDLREATPGQDARLKKWLDDTENVSEQSLADSRNAQSQLQQVQGRTGR